MEKNRNAPNGTGWCSSARSRRSPREYLKKGSLVYLQGRLQTRKWQGDDGQDRYTTEIVADRMKMLGGKGERDTQAANGKPVAAEPPFDDDIPF